MKRLLTWAAIMLVLGTVAEAKSKPKAYFTLDVSPQKCVRACTVTLKAEIHGPIGWCPSQVLWVFDDGWYGGARASHDADVDSCEQRTYIVQRFYAPGRHRASVTFKSGDALVAKPLVREIEVGTSPGIAQ